MHRQRWEGDRVTLARSSSNRRPSTPRSTDVSAVRERRSGGIRGRLDLSCWQDREGMKSKKKEGKEMKRKETETQRKRWAYRVRKDPQPLCWLSEPRILNYPSYLPALNLLRIILKWWTCLFACMHAYSDARWLSDRSVRCWRVVSYVDR